MIDKHRVIKVGNKITYPLIKKVSLYQAVIILYQATLDGNNYLPVKVPKELLDYAQHLYELKGFDSDLVSVGLELIPNNYKKDKDLTIYLYTGGKDSLASWLQYSKDTKHHKIFHIHGINQLYPLEKRMVEKHQDLLKHDIDIQTVQLPQLKNQIEHPVKNLLTYVLTLEYYKTVPKRFSFGFISFAEATLAETEEELEEEEEEKLLNEELFAQGLIDSVPKIGSPQVSEVLGDGENLSALGLQVLGNYIGKIPDTTGGMLDTIETFRIIEESGLSQQLSSCMSLTAHRDYNRSVANKNYAMKVQDVYLLAGSVTYAIYPPMPDTVESNEQWYTGHKKSIWDLENFFNTTGLEVYILNYKYGVLEQIKNMSELKVEHIYKADYAGDYECCSCFKCSERFIIHSKHLDYKYNPRFIDNSYKLLLRSMINLDNVNNIDFRYYLRKELCVDEELLTHLWKRADKKNRITKSVYETIKDLL